MKSHNNYFHKNTQLKNKQTNQKAFLLRKLPVWEAIYAHGP